MDIVQDDDTNYFIVGSQSTRFFLCHQLLRAHALLALAKEEELSTTIKQTTLNDNKVDSRQRMVDFAIEKRFVERDESNMCSSYCNLFHHILHYHKEDLQAGENTHSLVMSTTLKQLQGDCKWFALMFWGSPTNWEQWKKTMTCKNICLTKCKANSWLHSKTSKNNPPSLHNWAKT